MVVLGARSHEVADEIAAIEYCYAQGWTDGLPVVPPADHLVHEMLEWAGRPQEEVVATHAATGRRCSVFSAAVNAVMAGCRPEYFPVVLAALEAMGRPGYNFHASTASTGGSAPLLIVSGPIAEEIGMNSGANVFGPGNRANATIGRAIRLTILNVFKMIPGISDQSTQGNPGKYSFCIAEHATGNPWEPLNVELGYPADVSTVTVYAGGGFQNIENHGAHDPEGILLCVADSMANLGCISPGQSVVVLSPEHASIVASKGWSKQQVREFIYEHARGSLVELKRAGKVQAEPAADDASRFMHRGQGAEDILITVAGGDAGGHSAFIPSWSRGRASLWQTRAIGVCVDCENEEEDDDDTSL